MNRKYKLNNCVLTQAITVIALTYAVQPLCHAEEYDVDQVDKKFSVKELTVKVGDAVRFTNNDPFYHNVFSLSEASTFDLGSYPKGEYKKIEFDTPGEVEVECAIHPRMKMTITVQK